MFGCLFTYWEYLFNFHVNDGWQKLVKLREDKLRRKRESKTRGKASSINRGNKTAKQQPSCHTCQSVVSCCGLPDFSDSDEADDEDGVLASRQQAEYVQRKLAALGLDPDDGEEDYTPATPAPAAATAVTLPLKPPGSCEYVHIFYGEDERKCLSFLALCEYILPPIKISSRSNSSSNKQVTFESVQQPHDCECSFPTTCGNSDSHSSSGASRWGTLCSLGTDEQLPTKTTFKSCLKSQSAYPTYAKLYLGEGAIGRCPIPINSNINNINQSIQSTETVNTVVTNIDHVNTPPSSDVVVCSESSVDGGINGSSGASRWGSNQPLETGPELHNNNYNTLKQKSAHPTPTKHSKSKNKSKHQPPNPTTPPHTTEQNTTELAVESFLIDQTTLTELYILDYFESERDARAFCRDTTVEPLIYKPAGFATLRRPRFIYIPSDHVDIRYFAMHGRYPPTVCDPLAPTVRRLPNKDDKCPRCEWPGLCYCLLFERRLCNNRLAAQT